MNALMKWNNAIEQKKMYGVIGLPHEFIIFRLFYFYNNFRYPQRALWHWSVTNAREAENTKLHTA